MITTFFPDLLIVFAITLLAAAMGRMCLNIFKFEFQSEFEKSIFASGVGFFIFAYFTLIMGFAGLLYKSIFYAFVLFAALLARKEIGFLLRRSRDWLRKLKQAPRRPVHYYLLAFFAVTLLLRIIFNYAPLTDTDELIYHLSFPGLYIRHHAIIARSDNFLSYLPAGMEMLFTFGMLLRGVMVAKLMAPFFGLYSLVLIYLIAKRFLPEKSAFVSVVIFYFLPPVIVNFGMARVEFGYLFFALLALLAFLNLIRTGGYRWICLMAVMTGMSIFIKMTNGPFAVTLFIFLSWHILFAERRPFQEYLKWIAVFSVIVLLVPLPWFVHNYLITGSPFPFMAFLNFPVDTMYELVDGSMNRAMTVSAGNYLGMVVRLFFSNPVNSPGPLIVAFSLPLFFFKRISPGIKMLAMFAITNFTILIVMLPAINKSSGRYYFLVFALMSIISAYGIEKISMIVSKKVICSILFVNILLPGVFFNAFFGIKRIPVFLGLQSKSGYLLREYSQGYMTGSYAIVEYANTHIPEDSRILSIGDCVFTYPFYYRADIFAIHPEVSRMTDNNKILRRIKNERFTHIIFFKGNYEQQENAEYKSKFGAFMDIKWDFNKLASASLELIHQELDGKIALYKIR